MDVETKLLQMQIDNSYNLCYYHIYLKMCCFRVAKAKVNWYIYEFNVIFRAYLVCKTVFKLRGGFKKFWAWLTWAIFLGKKVLQVSWQHSMFDF